jgi:putative toxin-antitoxin system antitoxin component (TIGR02293 family)
MTETAFAKWWQKTQQAHELRGTSRAGEPVGHPYAAVLGMPSVDTPKLIRKIREGLPYSAWEHFTRITAFPSEVAAKVVQIPLRTLSRRKEYGRLHPDESDRLVRISRLFYRALELFNGDAASTRRWLTSAQPALGGASPFDYAVTDVGSREVDALIGRLEHGIPS